MVQRKPLLSGQVNSNQELEVGDSSAIAVASAVEVKKADILEKLKLDYTTKYPLPVGDAEAQFLTADDAYIAASQHSNIEIFLTKLAELALTNTANDEVEQLTNMAAHQLGQFSSMANKTDLYTADQIVFKHFAQYMKNRCAIDAVPAEKLEQCLTDIQQEIQRTCNKKPMSTALKTIIGGIIGAVVGAVIGAAVGFALTSPVFGIGAIPGFLMGLTAGWSTGLAITVGGVGAGALLGGFGMFAQGRFASEHFATKQASLNDKSAFKEEVAAIKALHPRNSK